MLQSSGLESSEKPGAEQRLAHARVLYGARSLYAARLCTLKGYFAIHLAGEERKAYLD